jgi:hypothetical protein
VDTRRLASKVGGEISDIALGVSMNEVRFTGYRRRISLGVHCRIERVHAFIDICFNINEVAGIGLA